MRVAGIDFSTHSVDVAFLDYEADEVRLRRVDVHAGDAFRAAMSLRGRFRSDEWEDVLLVYVERPFSQSRRTVAALMRMQGAILASLPTDVTREARVNEISPQAWKQVLTGRAGASKDDVVNRLLELDFDLEGAHQDAWDALGIAWAGREENRRAVEAAA